MTNDAKLGLVVGVCLVIGTAVVFFRKDLVPERGQEGAEAMATSAGAPQYARTFTPQPTARAVSAHKGQNHTVKHGESLYSLAHVTFEEDAVYDQRDAEGFIKLNALRLRLAARRHRGGTHERL